MKPLTANQLWALLDDTIEQAVMAKQHLRQGDREDVLKIADQIECNAIDVTRSVSQFTSDDKLRTHCQHK